MTRTEVAAFLREFANELDKGTVNRERELVEDERGEEILDDEGLDSERITFIVGGDSATVTVPNTVEFEVEVESNSPMFSSGVNQEIELELSWEVDDPDDVPNNDRLEIE